MLPQKGSYPEFIRPARLEEWDEHPHQDPSRDRDWPAEIRGYYRDLLKSIRAQKERFRIALPEETVRQNIRKMFEEGPKLTDPAAIRHRAIMASAEMEDYFRQNLFDSAVLGKYHNMDSNAVMQKDLAAALSDYQSAHRFFNEGTNILLETGVGIDDVTENRVYMTREEAYKKGIAALQGPEITNHFLPALDKANQATLETIASDMDFQNLLSIMGAAPKTADVSADCDAFLEASGLAQNKASGGAVLKAWEEYKDVEINSEIFSHTAFKELMADPLRNLLVRGTADWVKLSECGALTDAPSASLLGVAKHLYYQDALPEGYAEDLGIGYLADMKGVDCKFDKLLDEEIEYRQELLLKIQVHTSECMKTTLPSNADVAAVKKHLDSYDWSKFVVTADGAQSPVPCLAL